MDAEAILAAFERLHGVRITVHDIAGGFVGRLPESRLRHDHRLCRAAKAAGYERACARFDAQNLREHLTQRPDGLAKVCHAGLVELVVPHLVGGRPAWVLFAGVWADDGCDAGLRERRSAVRLRAPPALPAGWPDLLDALRSLAARLALLAPPALRAPTSRREAVVEFLRLRHAEDVVLTDLASVLGLSPSRTSHVVADLFGAPFATLLAQARLSSAEILLRCTALPVATVAMRAGFGDLSHFHASFRRRFGSTPAAWRRQAASA